MAEETSLIAQQVRLSQWAAQLRDCQNRPEGMDVTTWCEQHNITKANYYYRLKRVRQMCLDQISDTAQPAFVELQQPEEKETMSAVEVPVMRIENVRGLSAMLNDARVSQFKKVYLAPGYTDLRRGIDGLASIVRFQFKLDPYDKNTLFLFCGKRNDRIKALLWEGDGFLLMYKRLDKGSFRWPRSAGEAMAITEDQYRMLIQGLEIIAKNPIT